MSLIDRAGDVSPYYTVFESERIREFDFDVDETGLMYFVWTGNDGTVSIRTYRLGES